VLRNEHLGAVFKFFPLQIIMGFQKLYWFSIFLTVPFVICCCDYLLFLPWFPTSYLVSLLGLLFFFPLWVILLLSFTEAITSLMCFFSQTVNWFIFLDSIWSLKSTICSLQKLPHDAYQLLAVPPPISGILVICANSIHYHSQVCPPKNTHGWWMLILWLSVAIDY